MTPAQADFLFAMALFMAALGALAFVAGMEWHDAREKRRIRRQRESSIRATLNRLRAAREARPRIAGMLRDLRDYDFEARGITGNTPPSSMSSSVTDPELRGFSPATIDRAMQDGPL